MHVSELDDLEASVQELISLAEMELEEKRLQQQRQDKIEKVRQDLYQRLTPLLEQVSKALALFTNEDADSIARKKLEEKASDLRYKLDNLDLLAAEAVDGELIANEEVLLGQRDLERDNRWRMTLKADLIEMILEQDDFYKSTDAAVSVRGYMHELKVIGALEEVVDALMNQINQHSEDGPVARLRGTHEQTLNFIYNKALENRSRVERIPDVHPRLRHRSSERRPNPYSQLEGKVVIYGGHDRLETAVRNRLRDSKVLLLWCTAQSGLQMADQAESHVSTADLVIIITGYASHKLTDKAMQAMQQAGKNPHMVNTTGMIRLLEAIEYGLKTKLLMNQYSKSA